MRESKNTPPPLTHSPATSDRGRESTAESTPINTPTFTPTSHFGAAGRPRKGKDLYFSWHRKPDTTGAFLDSEILFEDSGDNSFPLFPESPEHRALDDMDTGVAPIDIATPQRFNSQSPRNQTSNLTFALQEAGAIGAQSSAINIGGRNGNDGRLSVGGRQDSFPHGLPSSYYGSGARQIPGRSDRPRRESAAGSFSNGMSWGGVSVGSWVRDDILMTGTSPYAFHQSPSFHSSSYLPKMEANFLKDYTCCGITLDSLHELLQHYEENHAQPSTQILQRPIQPGPAVASGRPAASMATGAGAQSSQNFGAVQQQVQPVQTQQQPAPVQPQDVDSLDDMEMDDNAAPPTPIQTNFGFQQQQQGFSPTTPQIPPLNMNLANTMQSHQGLRSATPTTPQGAANFTFNNPTVSSVNTPAFNTPASATAPQLTQSQKSPDSSIPGTPHAELDFGNFDFNNIPMNSDMMMQMNNPNFDWAALGNNGGFGGNMANFGTGLPTDMSSLTIDEPAKRLFSKQGGGLTQQQLQYALRTGQLGNDTDLARAVQQQLAGRLGAGVAGGLEGENKPFRCPVIGCEKAYKNQNGLKYHKQHGHQNQQLRQNQDGTFSIVDPVTSIPYPGTVGMEKEKPYRCEVCGKRYKNLNGLKYHRQHSPPCNPDLKLNMPNLAGLNVGLGDANGVNVAGAGLGMGIDGMGVGVGADGSGMF